MNLELAVVCALLLAAVAHADAPYIDPADDEKYFGPPEEELFWTPEQQVSGYRNMDKITWTRAVPAGGSPYPLARAERELGDVEIAVGDLKMTLDEYVHRLNVAGLIVVRDDVILYERYELGNTEESRWLSYSVAKSVTSMLVGAAIRDGYIQSVHEPIVDYLPRLRNSSYDQSTIRHVLQMSSGVRWNEDYADREADINQVTWPTLAMFEYLRDMPRDHEPGEVFNYNTAETNLVGAMLRSAVGNNLSTWLSEKIWRPFGMEHDAYWCLVEDGGGEFGGSSLNATLRDYARIGIFALRNGELRDGTRVLPDGWMTESTSPSQGAHGYGYQWWLYTKSGYTASGIFGQGIYVNPETRVVIALHSAWGVARSDENIALKLAMYSAIDRAVSN
jgi:CubicO group peptidase (beta-lactamase class C family)